MKAQTQNNLELTQLARTYYAKDWHSKGLMSIKGENHHVTIRAYNNDDRDGKADIVLVAEIVNEFDETQFASLEYYEQIEFKTVSIKDSRVIFTSHQVSKNQECVALVGLKDSQNNLIEVYLIQYNPYKMVSDSVLTEVNSKSGVKYRTKAIKATLQGNATMEHLRVIKRLK